MSLWAIRIFFLLMCILTGYAVSQVQPELVQVEGSRIPEWVFGIMIGFGFGGLLIAIDEMLKGFSLRAFSAATFGLVLGHFVAWMIDRSGLFVWVEDERVLWLVRLGLFVAFSYIGMVLAMRSNKEDFYLIIPFVRLSPQTRREDLFLLDTSAIIDGRVADLIDHNFLEGVIVVPRFILQQIADSIDPVRRARGRRGLDMLSRIQRNPRGEVKIHEGDIPEETEIDAKLVHLGRALDAKVVTCDYNLSRVAGLQGVKYLNISEVVSTMRPVILPGEVFRLRITREGRDKGQGVGNLPDGTMVIVNGAVTLIGQQVEVEVINVLQTGAGFIVFADLKNQSSA
jgi:uncharacterized protein YacL